MPDSAMVRHAEQTLEYVRQQRAELGDGVRPLVRKKLASLEATALRVVDEALEYVREQRAELGEAMTPLQRHELDAMEAGSRRIIDGATQEPGRQAERCDDELEQPTRRSQVSERDGAELEL